jgi:integrase
MGFLCLSATMGARRRRNTFCDAENGRFADSLSETQTMDYPDSDELKSRVDRIMTDYSDAERAPSTRKTYKRIWGDFSEFCEAMEAQALPADPETVAQYILFLAEDRGLAVATLQKRLAAVRYYHRKESHRSPTRAIVVQEAMEQVRRRKGSEQRQADPLLKTDVARILNELTPGRPEPEGTGATAAWLRDRRNAAIVAVGFAGAFRRAELRSLTMRDVRIAASRARVRLPQSKTDQAGRGETVVIQAGSTDHCPVRALSRWINTAGIKEGPIFRRVRGTAEVGEQPLTGKSMLRAVRGAAETARIEGYVTPHSLRAGYATQALINGVPQEEVMKHMRLSSVQTLMRYVRLAEEQTSDMTGALGL